MKEKENIERIEELEFEHNGTQYRFEYDELEQKNKYGVYETVCEIPMSYTKYANDKEIIEFVCRVALSIFGQGAIAGMKQKEIEIRNVLGIRE